MCFQWGELGKAYIECLFSFLTTTCKSMIISK